MGNTHVWAVIMTIKSSHHMVVGHYATITIVFSSKKECKSYGLLRIQTGWRSSGLAPWLNLHPRTQPTMLPLVGKRRETLQVQHRRLDTGRSVYLYSLRRVLRHSGMSGVCLRFYSGHSWVMFAGCSRSKHVRHLDVNIWPEFFYSLFFLFPAFIRFFHGVGRFCGVVIKASTS